jgi:hypothetical protein
VNTKRLRKIRQRLWEADSRCYWCGRPTVLPLKKTRGQGVLDPNNATLDHLISRLNPIRHQLPYYPASLMVLSCYECNNRRGQREDKLLRSISKWNSAEELKKVLTSYRLSIYLPPE